MDDLFHKKTVFIMGAGAHVPYGFPSGNELRTAILNLAQKDKDRILTWYKEKHDGYAGEEYLDRFFHGFENAEGLSIDRYLAANRQYDFVGRCAIVMVLIKYENKSDIRASAQKKYDDWYHFLINSIDDSIRNMPKEGFNPVFITFNYDRYLDYRLFNYCKECGVKSSDGRVLADHEVYSFMENNLKIYHVFGQLDLMPGQKKNYEGRAFGSDFGSNGPKGAIEPIRTTYLINIADEEFQGHLAMMRSEIAKAKRLIFLGFGFDSFNFNEVLHFERLYSDFSRVPLQEVYLTNIGLGSGQKDRLRKFFNDAKTETYRDLGECLIKNEILTKEFNCSELMRHI